MNEQPPKGNHPEIVRPHRIPNKYFSNTKQVILEMGDLMAENDRRENLRNIKIERNHRNYDNLSQGGT